MVTIDLKGQSSRVNQSKIRKNPDNWHDVVIPGMHGRDGIVTVPGIEDASIRPTQRLRTKTKPADFKKAKPKAASLPNPSTPIDVRSESPEYDPFEDPDDPFGISEDQQRQIVDRLSEEVELFGYDSDENVDYVDIMAQICALASCIENISLHFCWTQAIMYGPTTVTVK